MLFPTREVAFPCYSSFGVYFEMNPILLVLILTVIVGDCLSMCSWACHTHCCTDMKQRILHIFCMNKHPIFIYHVSRLGLH
uniref:Uncharacterized protein n=1 Tax=Arundo donax TaxID=35708 RepID=A0A0A9F6G4_ARUDO